MNIIKQGTIAALKPAIAEARKAARENEKKDREKAQQQQPQPMAIDDDALIDEVSAHADAIMNAKLAAMEAQGIKGARVQLSLDSSGAMPGVLGRAGAGQPFSVSITITELTDFVG